MHGHKATNRVSTGGLAHAVGVRDRGLAYGFTRTATAHHGGIHLSLLDAYFHLFSFQC
jgi:hypothetical protein